MPVFEGLLDEPHNSDILSLIFTFAEWHTLAKLRMHTDDTLGWLGQSTTELGKQIRRFARYTCSFFDTVELPTEEAARVRRRARRARNNVTTNSSSSKKKLPFNLIMYKLHALGDYVRMIWMYGTTDSYSTQPVSFHIRRVKSFVVLILLFRVNWSIDGSNVSMRVQIKIPPFDKWLALNVVNMPWEN